jgi:hypothetical protein
LDFETLTNSTNKKYSKLKANAYFSYWGYGFTDLGAGCDVGEGPGGLLLDADLGVGEQGVEDGERVGVDDTLGLLVRAGDDVADAAEGGAEDADLVLVVQLEEFDESWHHACTAEDNKEIQINDRVCVYHTCVFSRRYIQKT